MSIRRYKKDNEVPHSVVTKDSLCSNAHCSDARLIKAGSTAFLDQNRSFCCRKCLDLNRIAHREARAAISRGGASLGFSTRVELCEKLSAALTTGAGATSVGKRCVRDVICDAPDFRGGS